VAGKFSRRDFLRLSSLALIKPIVHPALPILQAGSGLRRQAQKPLFYGRVIFIYATIYSKPSIHAATNTIYPLETILPIYGEVESEDKVPDARHWYVTDGGFVYATNVQPVRNDVNQVETVLRPQLGEVTIPFVDALAQPNADSSKIYRLYYSTTHWVQLSVTDSTGLVWYQLINDRSAQTYFAPASAIRLIPAAELAPLSPLVTDKRIVINTTRETITAYENNRAVFTTRISSGVSFGEGKDFRTPLGDYVIYRKRPSRHMAAGDGAADDAYDLPGVPWVSYFNGGIALHGTYWHNDYGHAWSHGCINMLSQDAKWFYRWTTPSLAFGQDLVEKPGSPITVI
jgi:lipoprotein-anchoring transpeptidase ErfK/SrfK